MHGFLLLVLVFGAAFFTPEKKPNEFAMLRVVPSKIIEDALAGGGGNPKIAQSEDRQKGETLTPQPKPPEPVKTEVAPPKPAVAKAEPKVEPKPTAQKNNLPKDPLKSTKTKAALIELTPVNKSADRAKAKAAADAKARAEAAAAREKIAKNFGKIRQNLREGFQSGTQVEVSGPGGAAYASYLQFVMAAYDNAWQVAPDIADEDSAALARVVIHRTGRVISTEIIRRSGNAALDKSVRRALDSVTSLPPFPESSRDQERSFTIEFNLKAKRLIG